MLRLIATLCLLVCLECVVIAQLKSPLPQGAVVLESRKLQLTNQKSRTLVIWMLSPKKNPLNYSKDELYSCPDQTRGSHYSGPARVSLIETATGRIINTIKVSSYDSEAGDTLDLPYDIRRGYYYQVNVVSRRTGQGKPSIMKLLDYNGDRKALEFVLFDAPACMGLQTALIGYSEKQDKVIQYPVELNLNEQGKQSKWTTLWADYLFNTKPKRTGYWNFEVDYRGRGGSLDKWEVNYNVAEEKFEGTLTRIMDEP